MSKSQLHDPPGMNDNTIVLTFLNPNHAIGNQPARSIEQGNFEHFAPQAVHAGFSCTLPAGERPVLIKADAKTSHQSVMTLLDALGQHERGHEALERAAAIGERLGITPRVAVDYKLDPTGASKLVGNLGAHIRERVVLEAYDTAVTAGLTPDDAQVLYDNGSELIAAGGAEAHAFTYLDFAEAARTYGKVGGFGQCKHMIVPGLW